MPMTLGYLADMASDNVVSVCLGLERISRAAQAKSEVVQGVVGASPRSCAQRPRTQVRRLPAWDGDFGAFCFGVGFRALDEQLHACVRPGDLLHIEGNQLGSPQCSSKAHQEQGAVTCPGE